VAENARRHPEDVAVAKSWKKKRPQVTAFAYRLCHLERLKLDIMVTASDGAAMCPEFDGLVLFMEDLGALQQAVVRVEKSVAGLRKLKVKPYAQSFQQWLANAVKRYPNEEWTVKSKFPWKDLKVSWIFVRRWLEESAQSSGLAALFKKGAKKAQPPHTEIAKLVAAKLECTCMIAMGGAVHFDGSKWVHVDKEMGLHSVVKAIAHKLFRTEDPVHFMKNGKWHVKMQGLPDHHFVDHGLLVSTRMEVAADLNVPLLPATC